MPRACQIGEQCEEDKRCAKHVFQGAPMLENGRGGAIRFLREVETARACA
jgi:hypothetical protein